MGPGLTAGLGGPSSTARAAAHVQVCPPTRMPMPAFGAECDACKCLRHALGVRRQRRHRRCRRRHHHHHQLRRAAVVDVAVCRRAILPVARCTGGCLPPDGRGSHRHRGSWGGGIFLHVLWHARPSEVVVGLHTGPADRSITYKFVKYEHPSRPRPPGHPSRWRCERFHSHLNSRPEPCSFLHCNAHCG